MDKPLTLPPSEGNFRMIDVGEKPITRRHSCAEGTLKIGEKAQFAISEGTVPKGDILKLAEITGILAAKNTAAWIPLCHPIPIESIRVIVAVKQGCIQVQSFISGSAKTGFEMEAMTAVSASLLCLYDCLKGIESSLEISQIILTEKSGGKSGHVSTQKTAAPMEGIRVGVITVSDRVSRGESKDESGILLCDFFHSRGASGVEYAVVSDEVNAIRSEILKFVEEKNVRVVVTTGGTGLGPRDVTPEAIQPILEKEIKGISEKLRAQGAMQTENACLSRSIAGIFHKAIIIALPGSRKSVENSFFIFDTIVPHALHVLDGGGHGTR